MAFGDLADQELDLVRLLGAVASAANHESDPWIAVRDALESVCRFTGWPLGQAFVVGADGCSRQQASWHQPDQRWASFAEASASVELASGVGLPGRVIAAGAPAWVSDVVADPNFPRAGAARELGLHGAFAFPVLANGRVVAVLEFYSPTPVAPQDDFLDAINQVGMHLGRVFEREHAKSTELAVSGRLRQILDSAGDAFIGMDARGRITEWNTAAEETFGWGRAEVMGRAVSDVIVPEEYRAAHTRGLERYLDSGEARVLGQRLELSSIRRDGSVFPVELTLWVLHEADHPSFYAFARDITERKKVEASLAHNALHDGLTGLANRAAFLSRLESSLERMQRTAVGPAVLFLDLDRFKPINDTFGHDCGDQVLTTVAARLQEVVRPSDVVARFAGDEFVILLEETAAARDATLVADRITTMLRDPIDLPQQRVRLSGSVGVALARMDSTAESLIQDADAAMYQAKQTGLGTFDIFGDRIRERVTARLRRETELSQALSRNQLTLHYQPVFSLDEAKMVSVEALLRWNHPTEGFLGPADFIDIAEESGLIIPVGAWVLDQACQQLQEWRSAASEPVALHVAVNLSARQLADPALIETVTETFRSHQLKAPDLQFCLEVTESVLMRDPQTAAGILHALRELGVRIAVDDFGTGYSSLSYLKWFPVDTVKIDRSFIATIAQNKTDRAIVRAVLELAHELEIDVIAEGVESELQLETLIGLGCRQAQGFLLSRPQPAACIQDLLLRPPVLPRPRV